MKKLRWALALMLAVTAVTASACSITSPKKSSSSLKLPLAQFTSPFVLILIAAGGLSLFLHDSIGGLLIAGIAVASGLLGFFK